MHSMQKECLNGECPYGFKQDSVGAQHMATLLHRMRQLNELDHTDASWKYWYNPRAWLETEDETTHRYAQQKKEREEREAVREEYDSYEARQARERYAASREREIARSNRTY